MSGLSKPTVSLALANLERAGLVRASACAPGSPAGRRCCTRCGPEAGFVLGLDVGRAVPSRRDLRLVRRRSRAAIACRTRAHQRAAAGSPSWSGWPTSLCAQAGLGRADITQTVLGSPGVYDPRRDALALAGGLPGWDRPQVLAELRAAFGAGLMIENDVDAAALAERAHGHGRDVDSFAFVSVGTGIGMGLVLGGRLHRGAHGAAGEIGYLPLGGRRRRPARTPAGAARWRPPRRRPASSAPPAGRACAARPPPGRCSPPRRAATSGPPRWSPRRRCWWPGGLRGHHGGRPGADRARRRHRPGARLRRGGQRASCAGSPRSLPELRVSALGADAVVDGCLAAGIDRAWELVTTGLPATAPGDAPARAARSAAPAR